MTKADGAFLTIGELAQQLGVAQHILRYWESRFPQLRPLQRAGNRRYYRPDDVEVAHRIHRLLNVEGFTIKGAAKALAASGAGLKLDRTVSQSATPTETSVHQPVASPPAMSLSSRAASELLSADGVIERLKTIRGALCDALGEDADRSS